MYRKILVPLDGSPLAETALPYAAQLAKQLAAKLLLMEASSLPFGLKDTPAHREEVLSHAEFYLNGVQRTLTNPALESNFELERVQTLVTYGEAAQEINRIASTQKADLIVMSTHSYTGLHRLAMGSVAAAVMQQCTLPVILLRPPKINNPQLLVDTLNEFSGFDENDRVRLLVPLDGTTQSEAALEPVSHLAWELKAKIYLLRVIPYYGPLQLAGLITDETLDYVGGQVSQVQRQAALEYLERISDQLDEKGITSYEAVRAGNPVEVIVEYGRQISSTMLVMATHVPNKENQDRPGSIAEEVMRFSHLPVMVIQQPLFIGAAGTPETREVVAV